MAKQRIIVELKDETVRQLATLGQPIDVLTHLADSAADGARHARHAQREQTDESLKVERDKADVGLAERRDAVENGADAVVRLARQRADAVVKTARDDAGQHRPRSAATEATSESARVVLEHERTAADAALEQERCEQRREGPAFLAHERETTDKDLLGERAQVDTALVDQREANAQMVTATIRAQELRDEADAAKKRAEKGERELREVAEFREMFIGILGHDLRTPLGSIGMSAALMIRRGHLNAGDAEMAARIIRGSQRMTRMISQLLDLTRARLGGGLPIEPRAADLGEICRDVAEEFEATVQLEVEGDLTGTWDPDRLAEALSNLTGNAIEYAASGTTVVVKARADEAEVVVEVSNQGAPIPADVQPYIFEPFHRANPHEKSAAGNLGLGLYIADQIVRSHRGTLEARCACGTTTIVMRLPRTTAEDAGPSVRTAG